MQFKTTIITGIFLLLISSLSIAKPISKEISSQKNEQIAKKKSFFTELFIFKKTKNKKKRASAISKASLGLGIISVPLIIVGVGAITGLAAIITGVIALNNNDNRTSTRKFADTGIKLGASMIIAGLMALLAVWWIGKRLGEE